VAEVRGLEWEEVPGPGHWARCMRAVEGLAGGSGRWAEWQAVTAEEQPVREGEEVVWALVLARERVLALLARRCRPEELLGGKPGRMCYMPGLCS